jgi:Fe-S-cluster containining protein
MQQIEQFEKAFYQDGFNLGMNALNAGGEKESIRASLSEMYAAIDNMIASIYALAKQQGEAIHCKLGCEWCCHQPVFALDYEMEFLQNYINEYFDEETIAEISAKAKKKQDKLNGLKDDALLNAKYPCPLLGEGACMAYEARPMACRIYLSSDVNSCKRFFDKPDDKSSYPALMDMPMRLGRMMNEGFKAALKMGGISPTEFRIEEKL